MVNKTLYEFKKLVRREMEIIAAEYDSFSDAPLPSYKRGSYIMLMGVFDYLSSVKSLDDIFESEVKYDEEAHDCECV